MRGHPSRRRAFRAAPHDAHVVERARITETLKKVEAAGFNVGLKPHAQVKDEMARFMADVAPAFEGAHTARAA
jgi:hypothetical protein